MLVPVIKQLGVWDKPDGLTGGTTTSQSNLAIVSDEQPLILLSQINTFVFCNRRFYISRLKPGASEGTE